jgi:hypothetical protein
VIAAKVQTVRRLRIHFLCMGSLLNTLLESGVSFK